VCLASAASEPWLPGFCRAVFRANFAEDREIGNPEEIRAILDSLDVPGRELVKRAGTPENKQLLREQTSRAG
jgi:2-hydroxychromene-2-carboxylate isomerase